jgi:hypothetical protein
MTCIFRFMEEWNTCHFFIVNLSIKVWMLINISVIFHFVKLVRRSQWEIWQALQGPRVPVNSLFTYDRQLTTIPKYFQHHFLPNQKVIKRFIRYLNIMNILKLLNSAELVLLPPKNTCKVWSPWTFKGFKYNVTEISKDMSILMSH